MNNKKCIMITCHGCKKELETKLFTLYTDACDLCVYTITQSKYKDDMTLDGQSNFHTLQAKIEDEIEKRESIYNEQPIQSEKKNQG